LGISTANVAPEYGVEESRAYLALGRLEEHRQRKLAASSAFLSVFIRQAVLSERWRMWMSGPEAELPVEEVLADESLSLRLTEICGHFLYDQLEVREATGRLFALSTNIADPVPSTTS
jgi:D-tagatose-1,6-bisphosphate aldolase subunit GatZ/KbaZ